MEWVEDFIEGKEEYFDNNNIVQDSLEFEYSIQDSHDCLKVEEVEWVEDSNEGKEANIVNCDIMQVSFEVDDTMKDSHDFMEVEEVKWVKDSLESIEHDSNKAESVEDSLLSNTI